MPEDRVPLELQPTDLPDEDLEFEALVREVARVPIRPAGNVLKPRTRVGEYQIEAVVGRGGCGTVYTALHPVIGKRVAIKVLRHDLSSDPRAVDRFVKEAQAVNRIAHPNIVDVFGFGELLDGRKYCVMEFVEGTTLAQRYRGGVLEPAAIAKLLEPVAQALDAAHARGIVHRDLKPENILVDSQGVLKLLDFGIAKMVRDEKSAATTETGMVLGTPAYMSPEQCRGLPVDARSDVYALGVIVYELLTGSRPISGENVLQVISQQIVAVPVPPSHRRPGLSPAVDRAVLSMLAKVPDDRPSSASEALAALIDAEGTPVAAQEVSAVFSVPEPPATERRIRRRFSWQEIAGSVLLVVALTAIAIAWQRRPSHADVRLDEAPYEVGAAELPSNFGSATGAPEAAPTDVQGASDGEDNVVHLNDLPGSPEQEQEAPQPKVSSLPKKRTVRTTTSESSAKKSSVRPSQPSQPAGIAIDRRDPWANELHNA